MNMTTKEFFLYLLAAAIGYLLGSLSPGIALTKKSANIDIRDYGSKNSGATNVLRVMGPYLGIAVFLLDILKAVVACIVGKALFGNYDPSLAQNGGMMAGIFTVIGHNWTLYHNFKGGKGVASSAAAIVWMFPTEGLIAVAICIALIAITKFVSLGSISLFISFTVIMCIKHISINWQYCLWAFLLMVMGLYRHRSNIQRLLNGTENKLGQRTKINK
ncbi:MAG: glycerol-3-phosphate 1-O-acyltransferase PlsY [Christensenellaceae bacterium]|nr:glycerol-3-phosphate 1-O-acyltransferase PlsY [Christensenellaceae bacterium]